MAVHQSLGLTIDEVQTYVVVASKAATFSDISPLQEYIGLDCSTNYPRFPIIRRGKGFLGHILLVD